MDNGPAMLVMDRVSEVSILVTPCICSLLHCNQHVSLPILLHMVMRVGFNLRSWLTTSRGYLDSNSFDNISHFQLFGGSTISSKNFHSSSLSLSMSSKYLLAIIYSLYT